MKQIIIFFLVFISSLSAYCQVNNMEEANLCFDQGNYKCAEAKYKEVFKTAVGKDKQIAEIKIQRAKRCIENLKNADLAFNAKNYTNAKELYLAVLESNPNDATAKSQLEIINTFLNKPKTTTLSLSKTDISFDSSGGRSNISVDTNLSSYTINLLPTWCTVQKYDKYFVINCNSYNASTLRKDYFNVIAGDKTIRVNVIQQGTSQKTETSLSLSKTDLFYTYDGGDQNINVVTDSNNFIVTLIPSWCTFQKFSNKIIVTCLYNNSNESRSDWFKVIADNKEIKVYVYQAAPNNEVNNTSTKKTEKLRPIKTKLNSFSSLGFQSGEIAKYGLLYESGGRKKVGFHMSIRTSLTPENDILHGTNKANKTEIELGPNFRISNRVYLNVGLGYGYYNRLLNNDYAGSFYVEKIGYTVATTGLMYRISRIFNVNVGASFMDIDKDFYKPEITFGATYNLNKNNTSQINSDKGYNSKLSKKYKPKLSSFSSLGIQSGEISKYGLLYETGGSKKVGFHMSLRTTLSPKDMLSGDANNNKKEIELGPNFRISDHIYLNLGIGYGNNYYVSQDASQEYYLATAGIMYRLSNRININLGKSFLNLDEFFHKSEITYGISFNLR